MKSEDISSPKKLKTVLTRPFIEGTYSLASPLNLLYLASSLEKAGKRVDVLDVADGRLVSPFDRSPDEIIDQFDKMRTDIVGLTLFTTNLTKIYKFTQYLKKARPDIKIVVGGPHPTVLSKQTLEAFPDVDYAIFGEGEYPLVKLVEALENDLPLSEVPNMVYREKGKVVLSDRISEPEQDLDRLPHPARHLVAHHFRNKTYYSAVYGGVSDSFISSRGCTFKCGFCFRMTKGFRQRSAEDIVDEIVRLHRISGAKIIQIMDDNFTLNRKRCDAILNYLIREKLPCKIKIRSRVQNVDDELMTKLKDAGVSTIVYGIEHGNQDMLDRMRKRVTVEQNASAIRITRAHGVRCFADILLFYPGETPETIEDTFRFLKQTRPDGIAVGPLYPLPSTEVYEEAKANGTLQGDWGIDQPPPWIKMPWVDGPQFMSAQSRRLMLRYYSIPGVFGSFIWQNMPALRPKTILDISRILATNFMHRATV